MKKRLTALLLVIVMVIGIMPVGVFAGSVDDFFAGLPLTVKNSSGDSAWKTAEYDGDDVLVSGIYGASSGTSTIELTAEEDMSLSFSYKVSSEAGYAIFTATLGAEELVKKSGNLEWASFECEMDKGDVLVLKYKKNYAISKFDDCVYIKNLKTAPAVTVTFRALNGTPETATQKLYGGKGTLRANTFKYSSHVFDGWLRAADATIYEDEEYVTGFDSDVVLDAMWADAWNVTFKNGSDEYIVPVRKGETVDESELPAAPSKKGYNFAGWVSGDKKFDASEPVTADCVYTSTWTPITYTVVFKPIADSKVTDIKGEMDSVAAVYDEELTLPENAFVRDGYDFDKWQMLYSGKYNDGAKVRNLTDEDGKEVVFYATWVGKQVTVTLNCNYDGAPDPSVRTSTVGASYNSAIGISDPVRDGYKFLGWFFAPEDGEKVELFDTIKSDAPITLYAHWAETVNVTLDYNGGKTTYPTEYKKEVAVIKGEALGEYEMTKLKPSAPKNGYIFDGWYTKAEEGEKYEGTPITEDTTFYAHYRLPRQLIVFDANGGEGEMPADLYIESNVAIKLPKNTFVREGYDFIKWSTSKSSSYATSYKDEESIKTSVSSYSDGKKFYIYAIWEKNIFGYALDDINEALGDNIIREPVTLPTEGENGGKAYSISYNADGNKYFDGTNKITLPADKNESMKLTVTITSGEAVYTKTYDLILLSPAGVEDEKVLAQAYELLKPGKWQNKILETEFGKDKNFCKVVENYLAENGVSGITASIDKAYTNFDKTASIDENGNISFYFSDDMKTSGPYVSYMDVTLALGGLTKTVELDAHIDWDLDRVKSVLEDELAKLTLPAEADNTLTLPQEFVSKEWSKLEWSSDDESLVIGEADSETGDYTVTVTPGKSDKEVTLTVTATIKNERSYEALYNTDDSGNRTTPRVTASRQFTLKIKGTESGSEDPGKPEEPKKADYTKVKEAIASIPENYEKLYTKESAAEVTKAVEAVVYDLPASEQAKVDAFAEAILKAVAGLEKLKEDDGKKEEKDKELEWIKKSLFAYAIETMPCSVNLYNGNTRFMKLSYVRGDKVDTTKLPAPEREGYNFIGWYKDSALTKPAGTLKLSGNIKLYAKFEIAE